MDILTINSLNKQFTNVKALDDVSFNVKEGSITGLLGPNGAGKTTLLRIINGIILPDSGEVSLLGKPVSLETSGYIGYMPEERGLYDKMTVEDQIVYFGKLKGGKEARIREVMKEYLDLFNLKGQEKRKIKELSKGNQQKVQIITTLAHEPKLVILDEPFSGFDPINGAILSDLISRLQNQGTTIMLSSHNMPAIEEMCDNIALINHGRMLVNGSIQDIKEANRDSSLLLTTRQPLDEALIRASHAVDSIEPVKTSGWRKGSAYRIFKAPGKTNGDVLDAVMNTAEVIHFEEFLPSLKDIFLKYTSDMPAEEKEPEAQV